jgi:hypothetical protein
MSVASGADHNFSPLLIYVSVNQIKVILRWDAQMNAQKVSILTETLVKLVSHIKDGTAIRIDA